MTVGAHGVFMACWEREPRQETDANLLGRGTRGATSGKLPNPIRSYPLFYEIYSSPPTDGTVILSLWGLLVLDIS